MDSPQDTPPLLDAPAMPGQAELCAVMDQSDHEVAEGLTVPLADVLAELDDAADLIEARRHAQHV